MKPAECRRGLPPGRRVHHPQPLRRAQDARGPRAGPGVRQPRTGVLRLPRVRRHGARACRCCPTARLPPLPREPVRRALHRGQGALRPARPGGAALAAPRGVRGAARDPQRAGARGVWGDDETIGWVYQYFNSADERKKMRDESQAPRNSRELAVRNQFFTPRYVVQFLVDNTLGRTWLRDARRGDSLVESLRVPRAADRRAVRVPAAEGPAGPADPRPGLWLRPLPALLLRPPPRDLRGGLGDRGRSPAERAHRAHAPGGLSGARAAARGRSQR